MTKKPSIAALKREIVALAKSRDDAIQFYVNRKEEAVKYLNERRAEDLSAFKSEEKSRLADYDGLARRYALITSERDFLRATVERLTGGART